MSTPHTLFILGASESELELSGTEDPSFLAVVVSLLPPHLAYKEGMYLGLCNVYILHMDKEHFAQLE